MKHYTAIAIVGRGEGNTLMAAARSAGAGGGTLMRGRGTASSALLAALGLGDSHKDILVSVIEADKERAILDAMRGVKCRGVVAVFDSFRSLDEKKETEIEDMTNEWEMIQVICENGMSDDIMAVARKAGARGGTVVNARGTSTEADVKFFGAPLVPEKEILMIIIDHTRLETVLNAINAMPALKKKGMGIVFTMPVRNFHTLG